MSAPLVSQNPPRTRRRRTRKLRTAAAFLEWEPPAGPYKYEWVDGALEKSPYMMKNTERGIVQKIQRAFAQTKAYQEGGELFAETPVFVTKDWIRIPDLSFYDSAQIDASVQGEFPVPAWAIELISPNETGLKIERKALEYMNTGVQALWQIYPDLRMVQVRTSANSAPPHPPLPDMKISVNDLFG